jgi:hypothetical protein
LVMGSLSAVGSNDRPNPTRTHGLHRPIIFLFSFPLAFFHLYLYLNMDGP